MNWTLSVPLFVALPWPPLWEAACAENGNLLVRRPSTEESRRPFIPRGTLQRISAMLPLRRQTSTVSAAESALWNRGLLQMAGHPLPQSSRPSWKVRAASERWSSAGLNAMWLG
jgi:hypothetical protein